MNDVTEKFANMIESFECDFSLAKNELNYRKLDEIQDKIEWQDEQIMKDIELLKELSFGIRNGKIKILEQEGWNEHDK